MDLVQFIRLFLRYNLLIFGTAVFLAVAVFYMTRHEKRSFTSEALVNTGLVSGYNIETQDGGKTDYFYTSAELDNILNLIDAHETKEELGTRLLAEVLSYADPDPARILAGNYIELRQEIGPDVWDSLAVPGDPGALAHRDRGGSTNLIHDLIYSKHPLFGIDQLNSIRVAREGKSDMIRLTYTTVDPGICQRSLVLLIEIFTRKHREIKEGQSANVLEYFEAATEASAQRLHRAEEALKTFQERSKIINYYEQTRFIADKREDLYEQYMTEVMNRTAADSAMRQLEKQMNQRSILAGINRLLVQKRDSLSWVSSELARLSLPIGDSLRQRNPIYALEAQRLRLQREIRYASDSILAVQCTPRGTELSQLLDQWLRNLLALEDANARLRVIERRKVEFEDIYDTMAPLGSTLKRLEREIEVAEREYLENLHSLNQARLHRQSMLMATNLKVVDEPFYPVNPDKSKRMMLVIVAFLAGFILPLAVVIALEYFDQTLKKPAWAARITGLEVIGVIPRMARRRSRRSRIDMDYLVGRSVGMLLQNIGIELGGPRHPVRIALLSTRGSEGKSTLGQLMAASLRGYGASVALLTPQTSDAPAPTGDPDDLVYALTPAFFGAQSEAALLADPAPDLSGYAYVLLELPGLLQHPYPVELIAHADLALLVCRANRTWGEADRKLLERLRRIVATPVRLVVNGDAVDQLEASLGELPRRRSIFRRMGKRVLHLGFSARSKL
ncbi:MAG: hypothetical protein OHK0039_42080 [Bacteroidia bacterium]